MADRETHAAAAVSTGQVGDASGRGDANEANEVVLVGEDEAKALFDDLCDNFALHDATTREGAWGVLATILSQSGPHGTAITQAQAFAVGAVFITARLAADRGAPPLGVSLSQLLRHFSLRLLDFFEELKVVIGVAGLGPAAETHLRTLERRFVVVSVLFQKYKRICADLFTYDAGAAMAVAAASDDPNAAQQLAQTEGYMAFATGWYVFLLANARALQSAPIDLLHAFHLLICALHAVVVRVPVTMLRDRPAVLGARPVVADSVDANAPLSDRVLAALCVANKVQYDEVALLATQAFATFFAQLRIDGLFAVKKVSKGAATAAAAAASATSVSGADVLPPDDDGTGLGDTAANPAAAAAADPAPAGSASTTMATPAAVVGPDAVAAEAEMRSEVGLLDTKSLMSNVTALNREYDLVHRADGGFDERLFLSVRDHIGTPSKLSSGARKFYRVGWSSRNLNNQFANEDSPRSAGATVPASMRRTRSEAGVAMAGASRVDPSVKPGGGGGGGLPTPAGGVAPGKAAVAAAAAAGTTPASPHTGRRSGGRASDATGVDALMSLTPQTPGTPMTQALTAMQWFQLNLGGGGAGQGFNPLPDSMFAGLETNVDAIRAAITARVERLARTVNFFQGARSTAVGPATSDDENSAGGGGLPKPAVLAMPGGEADWAAKNAVRRAYATRLYYRVLGQIVERERERRGGDVTGLGAMLVAEQFHVALLACAFEVVAYAFKVSALAFPAIARAFNLDPFDFCLVVESFVRNCEPSLPRSLIRHLRETEEKTMQGLAWESGGKLLRLFDDEELSAAAVAQLRGGAAVAGDHISSSQARRSDAHGLDLMVRKLQHMSYVRIADLCSRLHLGTTSVIHRVWTVFTETLAEHRELFEGRHVDQIVMCAIYGVCRITKAAVSFKAIISAYRNLPGTSSSVFREVVIKHPSLPGGDGVDAMEGVTSTAGDAADPVGDAGKVGTIIEFYNEVFIPSTKKLLLRLQGDDLDPDALTPLPAFHISNSPVKIPQSNIIVSPLKRSAKRKRDLQAELAGSGSGGGDGGGSGNALPGTGILLHDGTPLNATPRSRNLYSVGESPSKHLQYINRTVRGGGGGGGSGGGPRYASSGADLSYDEDDDGVPPAKRMAIQRKFDGLRKR